MLVASVQTIPLPTITDDRLLDTLIKGRERIVGGWCQGQFHAPETNSYCMVGAIANGSVRGSGDHRGAENYLQQAIGWIEGNRDSFGWEVPSWNDNLMRTKDQVLAAFDKAIELRRGWIAKKADDSLALSA